MRVFVAGATGVLGRRIVRQFVARGHAVVALVRDDAGERTIQSLGGEPRRADLFDVESMRKAMEGCDVVLRAATSIPTRIRTTPKDWAMNDRIRREGTRASRRLRPMWARGPSSRRASCGRFEIRTADRSMRALLRRTIRFFVPLSTRSE